MAGAEPPTLFSKNIHVLISCHFWEPILLNKDTGSSAKGQTLCEVLVSGIPLNPGDMPMQFDFLYRRQNEQPRVSMGLAQDHSADDVFLHSTLECSLLFLPCFALLCIMLSPIWPAVM